MNSIRSSKFTKFKTELEIMQSQVNMLNEKYKEEIESGTEINIGVDLTGSDEENEAFAGAGETDKSGYKYYNKATLEQLDIEGLEREYLVNISKRKVIAIEGLEYEGVVYYTLDQIKKSPKVGDFVRDENVTVENATYKKVETGYEITLENVQCSKYVGKYSVKYKEANDSYYKTADTDIKATNYSFTVDKYGLYYIQVIDAAGKTTERSEIVLSIYDGITFTAETEITMVKTISDTEITTETATIPAGFTISGAENECAQTKLGVSSANEKRYTIDDGVVVYLLNGATVNWSDETAVLTAQQTYDQFVWVPVPNAVLDLSSNATALSSESNIKATVQEEIDAGRYPMAIKKDDTNYFGVLYQFSLDATTNTVKVEPYSLWTPLSTSNRREPAYLTSTSSADGSSYNNVGITESSLQSEYNTMVNKVASNKGFWVGRYETSNMSSSNANDSSQQIKVIKGTTTGINNVNWYRMYAQQKNYSNLASITATSSMIWGSQWDQIMIWMKDVDNSSQSSKYVVNSVGMGNFGTISGVDDGWSSTSAPAPTGYQEIYKVKNVYDLAGNVLDWTLEANNSIYRVLRGGHYDYTNSSNTRADDRYYGNYPYVSYTYSGGRSTLY